MTDEEKYKLRDICFRSKKGEHITQEEGKWIQTIWNKYPKEYRIVHDRAAKEAMDTVNPFNKVKE